MSIDWSKAPEGATHAEPKGYLMFYKQEDKEWMYFSDSDGAWCQSLEKIVLVGGDWCFAKNKSTKLFPRPKTLTQAVFDGLPPEYRWAAVDSEGRAYAHKCTPKGATAAYWLCVRGCAAYLIGEGYDTTNWQNSLIERQDVSSRVEQLRSIEEARQVEKDAVNNPSHYASGGIECIDAMQAMLTREEFIGYLRGNIFKYQWRYKLKNGIEDLKKAQWYANRLIELESAK